MENQRFRLRPKMIQTIRILAFPLVAVLATCGSSGDAAPAVGEDRGIELDRSPTSNIPAAGPVAFAVDTAQAEATRSADSWAQGGGFDPAVANKERLIEMLQRTGQMAPDLLPGDAELEVNEYLRGMSEKARRSGLPVGPTVAGLIRQQHANHLVRVQDAEDAAAGPASVRGVQQPQDPNLLAILMDFPDFPKNSIGPDDTSMYYEDYSSEHYQELLFAKDTYAGPNGERLRTARNWYMAQSGDTYDLHGVVSDWMRAANPAAHYGGKEGERNDRAPRDLVAEGILQFAASTDLDLNQFDRNDPYDLDKDGDLAEPDGIIDHLLVFHASVGQEAGGGTLGEDAIWAHRWQLPAPLPMPGTSTGLPYWDGKLVALGYTIQPADSAVGIVVHEHGHDKGLPDEYDTRYTGAGEPVALWSTMSSGSWAGEIPGSEPTCMSPYAREFLQATHGGNWLKGMTIDATDLDWFGRFVTLDEASRKGQNLDYVRVNLPDKATLVAKPRTGERVFYGGAGDNLDNRMSYALDLTSATASARLQFHASYDIEPDFDYGYVEVDDGTGPVPIAGNITTDTNPIGGNLGHGITGKSDGWTEAIFDLSAYVGQSVTVSVAYRTDAGVIHSGLFVDDVAFYADDTKVVEHGAEVDEPPVFTLNGFESSEGNMFTPHHYLVEWRSHSGTDSGLAHRALWEGQSMSYNQGMVVWYVDEQYTDNWVGDHPGNGFLGVVDADQTSIEWRFKDTDESDVFGSTVYQIADAAFSHRFGPQLYVDGVTSEGVAVYLEDKTIWPQPAFEDWKSYWNENVPHSGRKVPSYGLRFDVFFEGDRRSAKLRLSRQEPWGRF